MTRHNHHPSSEYQELAARIEEFAEENSTDDAVRAVADGLEDALREEFKQSYDVDGTTDGTDCIGRLIAGWSTCKHGWNEPKNPSPDHPPCKPPHADHADLWLHDGEPAVYTMHLYDLHRDEVRDIVDFADEYGLEVSINPSSWYFPSRTTHVVFYRPEWLRQRH